MVALNTIKLFCVTILSLLLLVSIQKYSLAQTGSHTFSSAIFNCTQLAGYCISTSLGGPSFGDSYSLPQTQSGLQGSAQSAMAYGTLSLGQFIEEKSIILSEGLDFKGHYDENRNANVLSWNTDNESKTAKFIIERSFENFDDFTNIREVNRSNDNAYNFEDDDISQNGLFIYRLREIDINGNHTTRRPLGIRVQRNLETSIAIYPNPAKEEVTMEIMNNEATKMDVTMFSLKGKIIDPNFVNTPIEKGNNKLAVNLDGIPAETYMLRIQIGNEAYIKKLSIID